jgi:hypothetical protein
VSRPPGGDQTRQGSLSDKEAQPKPWTSDSVDTRLIRRGLAFEISGCSQPRRSRAREPSPPILEPAVIALGGLPSDRTGVVRRKGGSTVRKLMESLKLLLTKIRRLIPGQR